MDTHPATDPNPSNVQYIGRVVLSFSFRFWWSYDENIRASYYHHYNIWNVNHKPLFGGRPCNNGMCSMVYYVLIHHDKNRLNTEARIKMSRWVIFCRIKFWFMMERQIGKKTRNYWVPWWIMKHHNTNYGAPYQSSASIFTYKARWIIIKLHN